MLINRASSGKAGRRGRPRVRRGGIRLGLLLRLQKRLSGLVGLIARSVEELRCSPARGRSSCPTSRARMPAMSHGGRCQGRPVSAERNQSSFYAEAIADCLEFIKTRASHLPAKDDKIDFCVADLDSKISVNGFPCKPLSEAGDHFLFSSKLARGGNTSTPNGSAVTRLDVTGFPGTNTLGVSMNRVDFAPGGTNPPHIHPRATEIGMVTRGELLVGIIGSFESGTKLYSKVLRAGDTFLIPRGLMHFQFNVGKTEATQVVSFNSQNPGIVFVPLTLFGSDPPIPTPVLTKALRVDAGVVELLKSKFAGGSYFVSRTVE